MVESFNAWILEAKYMLIRTMLEFIRKKTDGAFFIETGLELAGVARPFAGPDRYTTCAKRVVRWGNAGRLSDA